MSERAARSGAARRRQNARDAAGLEQAHELGRLDLWRARIGDDEAEGAAGVVRDAPSRVDPAVVAGVYEADPGRHDRARPARVVGVGEHDAPH